MPLYTYTCDDHGEFSAGGAMSESDRPRPCPACTEPASRALARPAIGGRGGEDTAGLGACGDGACAMPSSAPSFGGGCGCGAGGCAH